MDIGTNYDSKTRMYWLKDDVAREFGVSLGSEATARANGAVGGEITKRLVALSLKQLSETTSNSEKNGKFKY